MSFPPDSVLRLQLPPLRQGFHCGCIAHDGRHLYSLCPHVPYKFIRSSFLFLPTVCAAFCLELAREGSALLENKNRASYALRLGPRLNGTRPSVSDHIELHESKLLESTNCKRDLTWIVADSR